MPFLISGTVKKTPSANADPNRYTWLDLQNAEPDLGVPASNGSLFVSSTTGTRSWSNTITITGAVATINTLTVTGNSNLGSNSNVKITGGNPGQFIVSDGTGNLAWSSAAISVASGISNEQSSVAIVAPNGNITMSVAGTVGVVTVSNTGAIVNGNITTTTGIFTGNGSGLSAITGANVTGTVPAATIATTAGTVTTAAQPNITSVGTLTALEVTGNANFTGSNVSLGSNANVKITGGSVGQMLSTDGAGNLSWVPTGTATTAGTVTTNAQPNINSVGVLTGLEVNGTVTAVNITANTGVFTGNGSGLSALNGSNITTGTIAAARVATLNQNTTGYAATVTTAAQPNITSVGTLTGLEVNGTVTAANITANTGIFTGNGSGLSALAGANVTGTVPAATTATTAGTVTTAAQPNITSVGTLTSLAVTGNANFTGPNVSLGSNANVKITGGSTGHVLSTDGSGNLSWVPTGTATTAGTVTTNAQPNITSVGTLTSLAVTGDVSAGNLSTSGNASITGNVTTNANLVTDLIVGRTSGISITATGTNQSITLTPTGTGNVNVSGKLLGNLATPVAASDAATKQYVDDVAQGLHIHASCNTATNTTLASISGGIVTYDNGTAGVGATLTTTGSYTTIDGVTLSNGMRILVKNEAAPANNGIYVRTSATVLTRADDFNTAAEIAGGDFTFVTAGTLYNSTGWVQADEVTTVGTDPIVWVQFSGAGTYRAGTGLTLTGDTFSITNTAVTADSYGNGDRVASFTVNQQGQLTAAANVAITANAANLTGTTLASSIVNSSLTSVGTLTSLVVTGNLSSGNANLGATARASSFIGDGSQLTNLPIGTTLANGSSNVNISTEGGNVRTSVAGTPNVFVVTATGANVTGTLGVTANVTAPQIIANIAQGTAPFLVNSNTVVANLNADLLDGLNSATANTASTIAARDASGNLSANFFVGNGSQLTGIVVAAGSTIVNGTSNVVVDASGNVRTSVGGIPNVFIVSAVGANVTGTLGVTANVTAPQLISNVATGTAPLLVNSNTVVANLNASLLLGATSASANTANTLALRDASGNISANYFIGNGSQLTSIPIGTSLVNGTSSVSIPSLNGNVDIDVAGTTRITATATGANITGTLGVSSNANVLNLGTAQVLATANVTAPQVIANIAQGTAPFLVNSNTVVANLNANLLNGATSASANTANTIALRDASGNLSANFFVGNGSALTGITASQITGVTSIANGTSSVTIPTAASDVVTNVAGSTRITATTTGANITGTLGVSGNANVLNLGTAQVLATANITTPQVIANIAQGTAPFLVNSNTVVANLNASLLLGATSASANTANTVALRDASGNLSANFFIGNGSALTGITASQITGVSSIANGTSSVSIPDAGGNVNINVASTTRIVATSTGANVTGTLGVTANITTPQIIANIAQGTAPLLVNSNTVVANLNASLLLGATSASANTANTLALRDTSGNISANFFIGNGSALTGITASQITGVTSIANGTSSVTIPTAAGDVVTNVAGTTRITATTTGANVTGTLGVTANVTTPQVIANIAQGTAPFLVNSNTVVANLNSSLLLGATSATANTANTLALRDTSGNISANFFIGNGSQLTGISAGSSTNATAVQTNTSTATTVYLAGVTSSANGNSALNIVTGITANYAANSINVAGQFITTLATGTAPFLVNSNTVVANLNASLLSGATSASANTASTIALRDASGNLSANFFIGNGSQLTGITASQVTGISNGSSNINIVLDGNINFVANTTTTMVVTKTGANITGTLNTGTGNANVGNLGTTTAIITTGNITTINSGLMQNGTSNVVVNTAGGTVTLGVAGTTRITATSTGANVTGTLGVSGNANVLNLGTAQVLATANITTPQVIANIAQGTAPFLVNSNTLVANLNADLLEGYNPAAANTASTIALRDSSGNLSANFFIGNGSQLTGVVATSSSIVNGTSNVVVDASGNVRTGVAGTPNVFVVSATGANIAGTLGVTGNIDIGSSYYKGDGSFLQNLPINQSLANGSSNIAIPVPNGDIVFTRNASLRITVADGITNFVGKISVSSDANVGNLGTVGLISASGNITGGNISTGGALAVTGNATVGNLTTGGGTGGNITGANVISANTFISSEYVIRSVGTGISAAGALQSTATALTKEINVVSTVTAGQGVRLPVAVAGMVITIINTSAVALLVYPATGDDINGGTINVAYSQSAGATLQYVAPTTTDWYTIGATFA